MRVVVHPDPAAVAKGLADLVREATDRHPDRRVTVGLTGGSTPKAIYPGLRSEPIDWRRIDLWLSDERWVPLDHPDSNGAMVAATLADHVEASFHRPWYSRELTAEDAAAHYEATLRHLHPDGHPDLILLGMGLDGHTASLFPGSAALHAPPERWFVGNRVESLDTWRLTVTPALLGRAEVIAVLVTGAAKADMLHEAVEGEDGRFPIQMLRHVPGEVVFLVDEPAAARLGPERFEQPGPTVE